MQLSPLQRKYYTYLGLVKTAQDQDGFVEGNECDSLLFTSLVGSIPSISVDIDKAFNSKDGTWHRRQITKSCFPDNSKSTISRDMLLGLAWYSWYNKRLDISEQVIKYALSHFGIMGKAVNTKTLLSRCFIGPGLLSTFAWISYRLGGPSRAWLRWIPADYGHNLRGFQAHLQVLHILLRAKLSCKMSESDRRKLKNHASRQKRNPLFQYAVGNNNQAIFWLLNEQWWPETDLPSRKDRKSQWLPMRDDGPDWAGTTDNPDHKHSGGDFLFVAGLVLGKI